MTDAITARQFHEAEGVDDWRVLFRGAHAHFRTGNFVTGLALVNAIGSLAEAANHHPDVDLRYPHVNITLFSHDVFGVTSRDVDLARQISAAASDLGVSKSAVQAAVRLLTRRGLLRARHASATAVPEYFPLRPWTRRGR